MLEKFIKIAIPATLAFAATLGVFYLVPVWVELTVIDYLGPWATCLVLGDTAGCAALYFYGWKKGAIIVFLLTTVLECILIGSGVLPVRRILWLTNVLPSIILAVSAAVGVVTSHLVERARIEARS